MLATIAYIHIHHVDAALQVHSINALSGAIDVWLQPSSTSGLPRDLLVVAPPKPLPPILSMDGIMSSSELESGVLDVDNRVPRDARFVGNIMTSANLWREVKNIPPETVAANRAAKALTIWRWKDEILSDLEMQMALEKGGRSLLGTAYYLRRS